MTRRFRYCADPVFLTATGLYVLNKLCFKPWAQGYTVFFAYYVNDLLCIPFCLPPVLSVYRWLRLRRAYSFPTRFEVLIHLVVWSLFFEWIAPVLIKGPFVWTVADPWDVVAYAVGAGIAGLFWGTWRLPSRLRGRRLPSQPGRAL
jgi:hypothetical protein